MTEGCIPGWVIKDKELGAYWRKRRKQQGERRRVIQKSKWFGGGRKKYAVGRVGGNGQT
jgi:hypothetical protein